jgi:hypothetical protein
MGGRLLDTRPDVGRVCCCPVLVVVAVVVLCCLLQCIVNLRCEPAFSAQRCALCVVRCALYVVRCALCVARCALRVARCALRVVRCGAAEVAAHLWWPEVASPAPAAGSHHGRCLGGARKRSGRFLHNCLENFVFASSMGFGCFSEADRHTQKYATQKSLRLLCLVAMQCRATCLLSLSEGPSLGIRGCRLLWVCLSAPKFLAFPESEEKTSGQFSRLTRA